MDAQTAAIGAAGIAAVVRIAVWVARSIGLPNKWTPLVAVLLGVAIAVAAATQLDRQGILAAIIMGALAGGGAIGSHEVQSQLQGE